MRTIAGVAIGLGLGILLMYFSVSAFRVSGLAPEKASADQKPCVGIVFAPGLPSKEQETIAALLRDALPYRWMLRTAGVTADGVRESTPARAADDSDLPAPSHILLWGPHPWTPDARNAFGPAAAPAVVAYSTTPVEWAECNLTVPNRAHETAADSSDASSDVPDESVQAAVVYEFVRLATAPAGAPLPIRVDLRATPADRLRAAYTDVERKTDPGSPK
jgi:hypothetical protein